VLFTAAVCAQSTSWTHIGVNGDGVFVLLLKTVGLSCADPFSPARPILWRNRTGGGVSHFAERIYQRVKREFDK